MSDEVSAVTSRIDAVATEVGHLKNKVAGLAETVAIRHDSYNKRVTAMQKDLQAAITDNRESLVELVGKKGGAGSLKEMREDMTAIAESLKQTTDTLTQVMREREVTAFQTKVLWAAGGAVIVALFGLVIYFVKAA